MIERYKQTNDRKDSVRSASGKMKERHLILRSILPPIRGSLLALNPLRTEDTFSRQAGNGRIGTEQSAKFDLAYVLATGWRTTVLNETDIDGTYDARFKVAGGVYPGPKLPP
jgi:hypothetical protein